MRDAMAVRTAIDLMHVPSRVRIARSEPLPSGVHTLLSIAAGEQTEISAAMASTGRSCDVVQDAAGIFHRANPAAPEGRQLPGTGGKL